MSEGPRDCDTICPLTMAPIGQDVRLCRLCKGRKVARRLAELGLTPGVCLRVVQDSGGPLLVSVRNSRVALGRGIADKLTVQIVTEAEAAETGTEYSPPHNDAAEPVRGRGRGWRHHGRRFSHWGRR